MGHAVTCKVQSWLCTRAHLLKFHAQYSDGYVCANCMVTFARVIQSYTKFAYIHACTNFQWRSQPKYLGSCIANFEPLLLFASVEIDYFHEPCIYAKIFAVAWPNYQAGLTAAFFIMRPLAALIDFVLPSWHKIAKVWPISKLFRKPRKIALIYLPLGSKELEMSFRTFIGALKE